MVFPLRVSFELRTIKIKPRAGRLCCTSWLWSLKCGRQTDRRSHRPLSPPMPDFFTEFHHGNKAVATRAIPLCSPRIRTCPERCQRSHTADVNPTGMLASGIIECRRDVVIEALEALISPHDVFHVPKSAFSLFDAFASDCSNNPQGGFARKIIFKWHADSPGIRACCRRMSSPRRPPAMLPQSLQAQRLSHMRST